MANIKMRKVAELVKQGMPVSRAMVEVGYSKNSASQVSVTKTKDWATLLDRGLSDNLLIKEHKTLMKAGRLDKMEFPPGPKDAHALELQRALDRSKPDYTGEIEYLTDKDITEMLLASGCTVRRIVHGEKMRHVYFGCPDNRAKKDALEMAYKLKNRFAPDKVFVPIAPNPETENLVLGVLDLFVKRAQADQGDGRVINITQEQDNSKIEQDN